VHGIAFVASKSAIPVRTGPPTAYKFRRKPYVLHTSNSADGQKENKANLAKNILTASLPMRKGSTGLQPFCSGLLLQLLLYT
jgi:hypothetical protein